MGTCASGAAVEGSAGGFGEARPGQASSSQVMKSFTVPTLAMRSWIARWSCPDRPKTFRWR